MQVITKRWGLEYWLTRLGDPYQGKIICLKAGGSTSLHGHRKKIETDVVLSGQLFIEFENGETRMLGPGSFITLRPGEDHRMYCLEATSFVEMATPDHRAEDNYRVAREPGYNPAEDPEQC